VEVYDWVMGNGMGGSILTFWEITEGELTEGTGGCPVVGNGLQREGCDAPARGGREPGRGMWQRC